jgi:hypothetical protein
MIEITTEQLPSGYYKTESFINKKPFSSCTSLDREYTIKEVEKDCKIAKENLKR